jgi:Ubiquitin carboxyl-terminal hydrolase, family 1
LLSHFDSGEEPEGTRYDWAITGFFALVLFGSVYFSKRGAGTLFYHNLNSEIWFWSSGSNMADITDPHQVSEIDPDVPADRKRFIPLGEINLSASLQMNCKEPFLIQPTENNPEVMNTLIHKLGLSRSLSFHDVFSIDDPDLLAFVSRPANALLLVFPVSITYERYRKEEDANRPQYEGKGPEEPVLWYRQTIGNACGLMGLLHAVSNGPAKDFIGRFLALILLEPS